jgi:hypothetical protein
VKIKFCFLLFFLFVQRFLLAAPITVVAKANEVNALLQFLLSCERNGETYSQYKHVFHDTSGVKTKNMFTAWRELSHNNLLKFEGFPDSRYNGKSASNLVFIQSVNAKTINELIQNCTGFYTQSDLKKFSEVLHYFYPIYHKCIWLPYQKSINSDVQKLNIYIKSKGVGACFTKAANFYGVEWESEIPFYVMIHPMVGKVDYTMARPMGNVLIADYVLGDKNYSGWLGVVFHEMCHVLYTNQSREKQYATEHYFLKSNNAKYRLAAYNWFDETMATAIGNGYLFEKLTGKVDENEWYANEYIHKNARAVFPLVKNYLDSSKTMNGTFFYEYINLFEKTFPNINREANNLFAFMDIASDTVNNDIYGNFYAYFQPRWVNLESSVDYGTLIKTNDQVHTKIVVLIKNPATGIKEINEAFHTEFSDASSFPDKIFYACNPDGKNYLVFYLSSITKFDAALKKLADLKILPEEKGMILLD